MSEFFTRKGDDGYTGVLGKGRIPKDEMRADAIGTIDEANSFLGLARAVSQSDEAKAILLTIQRDLYNLMTEVSATPDNAGRFRRIDEARVKWLEDKSNQISSSVDLPTEFIVPGDTYGGAALDIARTVVRRAERRVVGLWRQDDIENQFLLKYLNRLSSLLFVLELLENTLSGQDHPTLAKD